MGMETHPSNNPEKKEPFSNIPYYKEVPGEVFAFDALRKFQEGFPVDDYHIQRVLNGPFSHMYRYFDQEREKALAAMDIPQASGLECMMAFTVCMEQVYVDEEI